MFKFLKDKIKSAVSSFSKQAEEAPETPETVQEAPEQPVESGHIEEVPPREKPDVVPEIEQPTEEIPQQVPEVEKKSVQESIVPEEAEQPLIKEESHEEIAAPKKGFFQRITEKVTTTEISEDQFEQLFWDLEVILLESNVAVEVIDKIKTDLKEKIVSMPIKRGHISEAILEALKSSVKDLFKASNLDLITKSGEKKPLVICLVGINGSGKTTTIAKLVKYFQKHNKSCVIAAADTFRAAAIDQLAEHASALNVPLIKHDYGADPAAVAFDAIAHAKAKGKDIVLIDTAGRLHSNVNLIDEMKKIIRVAKPDLKIFIGESITGNDCVEQAKQFDAAISLDGIILSKADIDEKGGAALSVSYVTGKPILFLGTGQKYEDLELFNAEKMMKSLGLG